MTTSARTDVLIAGAGPTGLALACDLARRGPQWTVLAFADTDTGNAPTQLHGSEVRTWVIDDRAQGALRDKGNTTRAAYGVTGPTTFLIRPDGYVGAIATTGDANTVLDISDATDRWDQPGQHQRISEMHCSVLDPASE